MASCFLFLGFGVTALVRFLGYSFQNNNCITVENTLMVFNKVYAVTFLLTFKVASL